MDSPGKINTLSLLFLFSPLSVLTTTWIFQAKTLLSVLFILLLLIKVERIHKFSIKDSLKMSGLFFLSITAKVVGILLPFYILYRLKEKFTFKKAVILATPLFLISLIYGVLNIKGITYLKSELNIISSPIINVKKNYVLDAKPIKNKLEIKVLDEITKGSMHYFSPFKNLKNVADRHIISLQNFSRLFLSTIGLNGHLPFYEDNLTTVIDRSLYLYVLLALLIIYFSITSKNEYLLPTVLLFIPISGYFYVPYMKHSYTSDHWFYPTMIFSLLMMAKFIKSPKLLSLLMLPIFTAFIINITQYYNFQKLTQKSYTKNKNPFILELIIQDNIAKNKIEQNYKYHDFILKNEDFNNPIHYKGLLSSTNLKKDNNLYNFFGRFAVDQIRSEDLGSLAGFILKHGHLYSSEQLGLLSFLGIFYRNEITESQYKQVIKKLK